MSLRKVRRFFRFVIRWILQRIGFLIGFFAPVIVTWFATKNLVAVLVAGVCGLLFGVLFNGIQGMSGEDNHWSSLQAEEVEEQNW